MELQEELELLFEPVSSKEELADHMNVFFNLVLPDEIVDENSTSTVMEFVWQIYLSMLTGAGPTRHVVAAARNTAKTLGACIVRLYGMIHFRRDGTHLAANLEQSNSASKYLDEFLRHRLLQPYIAIDNTRTKRLAGLPPNSYTIKDSVELRIAVATVGGVNSQRGSLNTRDEVDLVPQEILSEAAYIADPTRDEWQFDPIELNLSSRKTASGPIQELLDEAEKELSPDLVAHKWSAVDWMRPCPPSVHKPEEERVNIWLNIETLAVTTSEVIYNAMSSAEKSAQRQINAFAGCVACPAFITCQARAVKPHRANSPMLRSISFTADMQKKVKLADKIIAQTLNWKPERSAQIFKMFNRIRHFLKAVEFYKFISGRYFVPEGWTEEAVAEAVKSREIGAIIPVTPSKSQIYDQLNKRSEERV